MNSGSSFKYEFLMSSDCKKSPVKMKAKLKNMSPVEHRTHAPKAALIFLIFAPNHNFLSMLL